MLSFVKKFLAFAKKNKDYAMKDEEINAITDEEAKEFLKTISVDSLIDLSRKIGEIYLSKDLLSQFDGFIACIGKPGQGKSSLCSAYYKVFYGINKEIFSISNATTSFTKGLWILKREERQKIKQNIIKDIIDVEGFQVDDLSTWKYIMIVAFIATDLIVVNKENRMDEVKKILSIVWNSLDKMEKLGLPRIIKNIWIQINRKKKLEKFVDIMESICNKPEKWKAKGIDLHPFLLEAVNEDDLEDANDNILEVESYLKQVKQSFEQIQNLPKYESVSTLLSFIGNFNDTMNGKDTFNMEHIEDEIKNDFNSAYTIIKHRKEKDLLQKYKKENFDAPKNSGESYEDFINRQKIDFQFNKDDVIEKFTFYNSSPAFDEIYNKLISNKNFKADTYIFKDYYDTFIEEVKIKEENELERKKLEEMELKNTEERKRKEEELKKKERERDDALNESEKIKLKINDYYDHLKFYKPIDSYSSYKYDLKGNYSYEIKNEYNSRIRNYYYEKEKKKRIQWQYQIEKAKYKCLVQTYGENKCKKGHEFSDLNVGCGSCKEKGIKYEDRLLYWVDADEHYGICKHCDRVRLMDEKVYCGCGEEAECLVKFISGWRPG